MDNREIGQKLLRRVLSSLFGMGLTIADFHIDGNSPHRRDILKRLVRMGEKDIAVFFSMSVEMRSAPLALFSGSVDIMTLVVACISDVEFLG